MIRCIPIVFFYFQDVFALDKDTVVAVRFNMIMRVSHLMALDGCGWLHDEVRTV